MLFLVIMLFFVINICDICVINNNRHSVFYVSFSVPFPSPCFLSNLLFFFQMGATGINTINQVGNQRRPGHHKIEYQFLKF